MVLRASQHAAGNTALSGDIQLPPVMCITLVVPQGAGHVNVWCTVVRSLVPYETNHPMIHPKTLSQKMNALRKEGYTHDLRFEEKHLKCDDPDLTLTAADIVVDSYYRFEGMSDPGDSSILYAISVKGHGLKGLLIHAYGVYSEQVDRELVLKLQLP